MVCLNSGDRQHYVCATKVDSTKMTISGWYAADYKWWHAIGY